MKYRAEIDGLRAIAVLSVTLFHFFPISTSYGFNGYLGVDVFFVISGFLISTYIYDGLNRESFSFKDFYLRRVRRILPAAFFVLFLTTIISIPIMTSYDLSSYFKSLLATILFVPNIYFWRTGGYFGDLDAQKPLLHYWSLGVEEQFYLFFPLFLYLCYKFFHKKNILKLVVLITVISLALNIFAILSSASNPAFFLLPTRIWEFGCGSLAALLSKNRSLLSHKYITNLLFSCLIISFFFFNIDNLLPISFPIVLVTAVFLTIKHDKNTISYKVLSNSIMRYIGKISFSLYLFHWPAVVFIGYIFIDEPPLKVILLTMILTFILSHLSYYIIEEPFRKKYQTKLVVYFCVISFFVLGTLSLIGINSNLLKYNSDKHIDAIASQIQTVYKCPVSTYQVYGGSRACNLKGVNDANIAETILLGNSHAQMYAPIFIDNKNIESISLVTLNGCLPTTNINISKNCSFLAKKNISALKNNKSLKSIYIGMTWYKNDYTFGNNIVKKEELLTDILALINYFEMQGIDVYVLSPIPIPNFYHASELSRKLKFKHITLENYFEESRVDYKKFYKEIELFDIALHERLNSNYIKIYKNFCDQKYCYFGDKDGSYYSDNNHLGSHGLSMVKNIFQNQ